MSFQSRIDQDIKSAMLAREAAKLSVLRILKTSLMNAAIEKGGAGSVLDDPDALAIVRKEVKKRQDSVEAFEKGGRPEMAASEKAEIDNIAMYASFLRSPLLSNRENADVKALFERLMRASENHLKSFRTQLSR